MKLSNAQLTTLRTIAADRTGGTAGTVDVGTHQPGIYSQSLAPLTRAGLLTPEAIPSTDNPFGGRVRHCRRRMTAAAWELLGLAKPEPVRTVSVVFTLDGTLYEIPCQDDDQAARTLALVAEGIDMPQASTVAEGRKVRHVTGADMTGLRVLVEVDGIEEQPEEQPEEQTSSRSQLTRQERGAAWKLAGQDTAARRGVTLAKSPCADGARYVEISAYPLTGTAARLVCGCGSNHWAKAVDGYRVAASVPTDTIADMIRREGYVIAGDWADSVIGKGGEWQHAGRRAPVRLLPEPEPVPVPDVWAGDGDTVATVRADGWWTYTTANRDVYEVTFRPARRRGQEPVAQPLYVSRRITGNTLTADSLSSLGRATTWTEAVEMIRADSATRSTPTPARPVVCAAETPREVVTARVDDAAELVEVEFPGGFLKAYAEECPDDDASDSAPYRLLWDVLSGEGKRVKGKRGVCAHGVPRYLLGHLADLVDVVNFRTASSELAPGTRSTRIVACLAVSDALYKNHGAGMWPMGHGVRPFYPSESAHCEKCAALMGPATPEDVATAQAEIDQEQRDAKERREAKARFAAERESADLDAIKAAGLRIRRDSDGDELLTRPDSDREWSVIRVRPRVYEVIEGGRTWTTVDHPIAAAAYVARLDLSTPRPLGKGDTVALVLPVKVADVVGEITAEYDGPHGRRLFAVQWPGAAEPVIYGAESLERAQKPAYTAGQVVKLKGSRGLRGTVQGADGNGWSVLWENTPKPVTHAADRLEALPTY